MSVIPVRHIPDPVLREKTKRVPNITPALRALVDDMIETMYKEHGVGIAANQVGRSLRVTYIEIPEERDEDDNIVQEHSSHVLINPEIIRRVGEREVEEGCLSIPGWRGKLIRSERVTVKALDLDGREIRIKADGLLAQALEHETDHLNGIVYIDRMENIENLFPLDLRAGVNTEEQAADNGEPKPPPDPNLIWRLRQPVAPVVRRR
ncbi:MAG: peptide deformylase [Dehalococcoidia bacterium]|nr:peptide deformylase [Dehalococcoidia bacterium]